VTWTAAVIVSPKRGELVIREILPVILACQPDQTLIVGDLGWSGQLPFKNQWQYLHIPDMTRTTNDALVKRDVAALASQHPWIAYFSDDHKPTNDFGLQFASLKFSDWDVFVPARYAAQPGHEGERLNMGEPTYCGGHAGLFRRSLIQELPWCAGPHHREWDLLNSQRHIQAGARYHFEPNDEKQVSLRVFDIEPGASPWL